MKKIILFFAAVVLVAGISAFCTMQWTEHHATEANEISAHKWLHQELQLTEEQHRALEPIEAKFADNQRQLSEKLRAANKELARVMGEEKAYTPRVATQVEMVHHCMGDLQKASIDHLFEMRTVLTPAQGDKLLALGQLSLEQSP